MDLEALSREFRSGLPWEMLYANNLAIIAESVVQLEERYLTCKNNIDTKGLKVNIRKTKIMKCGTNEGPVYASGKYPCSVCKKRVGRNSMNCSFCKHWVHKRCSGFIGRLIDIPDFKCHSCLHLPESEKEAHKFKLGNSDYERVNKFCYLGDILSDGGRAEESSITRITRNLRSYITSVFT